MWPLTWYTKWQKGNQHDPGSAPGKKKGCSYQVGEMSSVAVSLSDPWSIAAIILFGLLSTVAIYRTTRVCCTCSIDSEPHERQVVHRV